MKKLFLIALAAMTMGLVACNGGNNGNTSTSARASNKGEAQNVEQATDGITFEGEHYTVTYPKDWKETFATGDVLNAKSADDAISLSINFDETGPSVDQLKETGANVKLLNQQDYKEIGDPQIDGNKLVVRRVTNEGEIDFSYLLVIEGTKGVMGSVKAPADKEADAEKALNSILASVKMK